MNELGFYLRLAYRMSLGCLLVLTALAAGPRVSGAQTIGWEPLTIDFGGVLLGNSKIRTVTLTNTATGKVLNIESIEFTFNDRDAFSVEQVAPAVLGPGESLDVDFTFEPPDYSFFFGDVLIANDSTNAPQLNYQLLGEGAFGTTTTTTTTTSSTSTSTSTTLTTTTTLPPLACGDPVSDGQAVVSGLVTASDALFVLSASVGLRICDPCLCDVNASGSVTATDALVTLNVAVGLPAPLECPPCD